MGQFVSIIAVSRNKDEEKLLKSEGLTKIDVNLSASGDPAYIWYFKAMAAQPITKIEVSWNDKMADSLSKAGFTKVYHSPIPGSSVYLWFLRGTTNFDIPVTDLDISTNADGEALKIGQGWERVGYNLSGANGKWMYLWIKRPEQTYISDVTATDSYGGDADLFKKGYTRIDETTNTISRNPSTNFLWYRLTTDARSALTDLQISQGEKSGYSRVDVNLNGGTPGKAVYLWYKKENGQRPVAVMGLLLNKNAIDTYIDAGIHVSENINICNSEEPRYLFVHKQQ